MTADLTPERGKGMRDYETRMVCCPEWGVHLAIDRKESPMTTDLDKAVERLRSLVPRDNELAVEEAVRPIFAALSSANARAKAAEEGLRKIADLAAVSVVGGDDFDRGVRAARLEAAEIARAVSVVGGDDFDRGVRAAPPDSVGREEIARAAGEADGVTWTADTVTYRNVGEEYESMTARYYRIADAILAALGMPLPTPPEGEG